MWHRGQGGCPAGAGSLAQVKGARREEEGLSAVRERKRKPARLEGTQAGSSEFTLTFQL